MSCYFRYMKDVLADAGIEVTKENKKMVDQAIHELVAVEYKDCSPTWKQVKEMLADEKGRAKLVKALQS